MRKTGVEKPCSICGKMVYVPGWKKDFGFCSRHCANIGRIGTKNNTKKISINNGYILIYVGKTKDKKNIYISQHRKIMALHLNRPLLDTEVVHHKDKNRSNNDISNLLVLTRSEHIKLHNREKKLCQINLV
jgi:endogenous inhibitor of DNA gyrase (YacG/DUF329 family)